MILNIIGWIGSIGFALCALPDAYRALKTKKAPDYSNDFLGLWFTGEFCSIIYFGLKFTFIDPIMFNYLFNFACLCVIIFYKWRNR